MMKRICVFMLSMCVSSAAICATVTLEMKKLKNKMSIGTVKFQDSNHGLLVIPNLKNLSPGLHGLHIHEVGSCEDGGMAAKGHLDPFSTLKHEGPYKQGHLGDLPVLYVADNGVANVTTLAPRLNVKQLFGHSIMIHQGGDNYSDEPQKLGGGGARFACGVIPAKTQR